MRRVLVTGANGFIGMAACVALVDAGFSVRAAVRTPRSFPATSFNGEIVSVGNVGPETDWGPILAGVDAVVHLTGRVHVLKETSENPLKEFRSVNVLGTERLACDAARAGVRRVVFLSSIGVHGRVTYDAPFTEEQPPSPHNEYTHSKWEAEQALRRAAVESGFEAVVLRSPLVYGPRVKANFLRLMNVVDRRLPLPLGSVRNRRSLIYVGNLVDCIASCVNHPAAAGETFLVSDGEDVSTPELIQLIAYGLRRPSVLLPFPPQLLRVLGRATGKWPMVEPLLDSLVVDSGKIRRTIGWKPPYEVRQGIEATTNWFRSRRSLGA